MSRIKSEKDIKLLRESGKRLSRVISAVRDAINPGVKATELDQLAERLIVEGGDVPAFKNYQPAGAKIPFPASLCVSINDEVVHGIPSDREIKEGDIVSVDLGLSHEGLITDMATTVMVGKVSPEIEKLVSATRESLKQALKVIKDGTYTGDVGFEVEKVAHKYGLGVVMELGGHGVGHHVHEEPYIPNFGERGMGEKLRAGMVIAIEPMLTLAGGEIKLGEDDFTYKTKDGSTSAHFEVTVLVTEKGVDILTPQPK